MNKIYQHGNNSHRSNVAQNSQHNNVVKHNSPQTQQTSISNSHLHQPSPAPQTQSHHHHNHPHHPHHHHNHQSHLHPLHHPQPLPIPNPMQQQQWVPTHSPQTQSSQAPHHHPQTQQHQHQKPTPPQLPAPQQQTAPPPPSQAHHHNQHRHPLHHPQPMSISAPIPQQQWVPTRMTQPQSPQAPHHHPQNQKPPPVVQPQPPPPQQQQPPPPPSQQQPPPPPPPQQPPHHLNHPQAPPMMINQQFPNPNFLYTQLGHGFVPQPGHIPQYDHSPTASHQSDPVSINSQQQPVSIGKHHTGSVLLNQMQTVINTASTGSSNVHPMNNSPMIEAHMSNRLPSNQNPYMIPNPYIPNTFNLMVSYPPPLMNPYPSAHLPPPNSAMMPQLRVNNDLNIRQQYDPHNQANQLPQAIPMNQAPGVKQPNAIPTQNLPFIVTPIKPRERKALAIVDPVTRHVFSEAELKGVPSVATTPQSQSSKDSGVSKISPKDSLNSEKESFTDDTTTKSTCNSTSSDIAILDEPPAQIQLNQPQTESKLAEPKQNELKYAETTQAQTNSIELKAVIKPEPANIEQVESKSTQIPVISQDRDKASLENEDTGSQTKIAKINEVRENGRLKSDPVKEITTEMSELIISVSDKSSDEPSKIDETLVKTMPNLTYAAGQFSPLNPNGRRKYSIEFLKAVAKEININLDTSARNAKIDFVPHFVNQGHGGGFRDFTSSQPTIRRSSQQVNNKPRRIILTQSLPQEVELKTAETPWKPELLGEDKSRVEDPAAMDTKRLLKVFRGHLNKLTPEKYDSLIEKIALLDLDGSERLTSVIDLVFDKAVDEPGFCELYARMCRVISAKDPQFNTHLVKKCQAEFETSDLYDGLHVEERKMEIEKETEIAKKKLMSEELYDDMRVRRKKYLGTIKLIGEMYKISLLSSKIIGVCMKYLIRSASNENIECLCSLIATVGHKMAEEKEEQIKSFLQNTLTVLHDIAYSEKVNEAFILESRIKFKILDTIETSKRNWQPRVTQSNPKRIEEIREEAKEELLRQQHRNHSSRSKGDRLGRR